MGISPEIEHPVHYRAGIDERPLDLIFLSAQTLGDRRLEKDILNLFLAQMPKLLIAMKNASTVEDVKQIVHNLKGAARSIGAFHLAALAEASEGQSFFQEDVLDHEIARVCDYIRSLDD